MKSFILLILGFIFGSIVSSTVSMALFGGMGSTLGMASGLQAGACLVAEAARENGHLTEAQADEAMNAAIARMESAPMMEGMTLSLDAEGCTYAIGVLRTAPSTADYPMLSLVRLMTGSVTDAEPAPD